MLKFSIPQNGMLYHPTVVIARDVYNKLKPPGGYSRDLLVVSIISAATIDKPALASRTAKKCTNIKRTRRRK